VKDFLVCKLNTYKQFAVSNHLNLSIPKKNLAYSSDDFGQQLQGDESKKD